MARFALDRRVNEEGLMFITRLEIPFMFRVVLLCLTLAIIALPVAVIAQTPVPITDGVCQLTAENCLIQFVGTHMGDNPDPRTGHFQRFTGEAKIDPSTNHLASVNVEIETESLWTPIPNLTNHLKSPDFFDARQYPQATFASTEISQSGDGGYTIKGNLTILGNSQEISFPAKVQIGAGLTMAAELTIDRTQFGMDKLQDQVVNTVELKLAIGETASQGGPAGPGRGPGNFDPEAFFKGLDRDQDDKLTGDEIPARMNEAIDRFDTDGDGSISKSEFMERARRFGNRRPPQREGTKDRPARPQ
jgi:polyisoprenoid-binding protein YceI